jgi:small subunit ribosomal protein S2
MIVRTAVRSSSRAIARRASRPLPQFRFISTETEAIESSVDNSLKNLQSIHAQLNAEGDTSVPAVNPETHATASSVTDHVAEQYHMFKQQG